MTTTTHWNLRRDGIAACANMVKLRLTATGGVLSVYVRESGDVVTERTNDPRRSHPLPAEWLAGVYTKRAQCDDIAEDLQARALEMPW